MLEPVQLRSAVARVRYVQVAPQNYLECCVCAAVCVPVLHFLHVVSDFWGDSVAS